MLEPQAPHATINQRNVTGRNEAHVAQGGGVQGEAGAAELMARLREAQEQVTAAMALQAKSQEQIDRLLGIIEGLTGRG